MGEIVNIRSRKQFFIGKFLYLTCRFILCLDGVTKSVRSMFCSFDSDNFRAENSDLPGRSSKVSIPRTELNAGRKYHLPAGRLNTTWLREILNLRSQKAILVVKVLTFPAEK